MKKKLLLLDVRLTLFWKFLTNLKIWSILICSITLNWGFVSCNCKEKKSGKWFFKNLKTNSFEYYLALIQCFLTINLILMCLIELFRFLPVVKNFLKIINKNRQKETNKGHQVVLYQVHNYLVHRMSTTNIELWLCQLFPWFVFIYFSMRLKVFEWNQNRQKVSKHQFILHAGKIQ